MIPRLALSRASGIRESSSFKSIVAGFFSAPIGRLAIASRARAWKENQRKSQIERQSDYSMILNEPRALVRYWISKNHIQFLIKRNHQLQITGQGRERERWRERERAFINALVLGNREFSLAYLDRRWLIPQIILIGRDTPAIMANKEVINKNNAY